MPMFRRPKRFVILAALVGVVSGSLPGALASDGGEEQRSVDAVTKGGESGGEVAGERQENGTDSGRSEVDPSLRRSPVQVRRAPVAFSSDLEPVGDEAAKTFLEVLCPDKPERVALEGRDEKVWSCGSCPGFTSLADSDGPLVLHSIIRGSFIESDSREAFVTYRGCEPQNAAYGGAVIFRRRSGGWEATYRHPGLNPQACLKFSSDEHEDRLACRLRYESEGRVVEKIVDAATRRGAVKMMRSIDNTARCPTSKFISSYMVGWERRDVNSDGRLDLVVDKIQRQEPLGKNNEREVCSIDESDGKWDRARKMTGELRFSGKRFHMHGRRFEPLPRWARRASGYADRADDDRSTGSAAGSKAEGDRASRDPSNREPRERTAPANASD